MSDAVSTGASDGTATTNTADVVVIGAGIVGAAAARSLAEAGRDVLLLERFDRGHDRGSSHGASRIFRQGYPQDDYVQLTSRALDEWRELEAASGRSLLTLTGAVDHGDPVMIGEIAAAFERNGVPFERLSAEQSAARWPGLRFDGEVLHHASGGRIASAEAIEALLDRASAAGARLRFGARVTRIAVDADLAVITTEDGEIRAAAVVVAAGSWTPGLVSELVDESVDWPAGEPVYGSAGGPLDRSAGRLAADAGGFLPEVEVTQVQPAHFPTALPGEAWPSFVHYLADGGSVYGLFTPGEGVKVGHHGMGVAVDPDERDFLPEPGRLAALTDYVREWVPGADADRPALISCMYDTTPTEDFVLDRAGPVTYATGFSGHGFKFGPVLGDLLAGIVAGDPPPQRFRARRSP